LSEGGSRVRAVSLALAARPLFWAADHLSAARASGAHGVEVWRAWRMLRRRAASLRWNDYDSVHAARAAGLDPSAVTWGETPLVVARHLLKGAGVDASSRVLDLGAGIGTFLLAARALGAQARGVELVRVRALCGAPACVIAGASLEEGDARHAPLDVPWTPTHVVLSWTCWPQGLREGVAARLRALAPGTRVLAFTHAVGAGFGDEGRVRAWTASGPLDALAATRS
jgi:SAM-dependent methyltransferase